MRWSTGAVLAGVLALASCKAAEPAQAPEAAGTPQALFGAAGAQTAPMLDGGGDVEDGDLVGTELHGDHAEVAAGTAHPRDLPRLYPEAYDRWRSYVARVNADDRGWVDSLDATSTVLDAVTVGGSSYIRGWVCERHNCAGNDLVFLMAADQSQIIGFLRLTLENGAEVERVIGPVNPDQLRCLRVFMDDRSGSTAC